MRGTDDASHEERTAPPRRLSSALARLGAPVLDFLLPPVCVACSARVASRDSLCPACWTQISFIQPPLCDRLGIPLPYDTGARTLSARALSDPPVYGRARAVADFGGAMRELIHRFKYADQHHPRRLFGRWLAVAGRELLADADVLVPIPLHRWRLARRRFNQAAELAREVSRLTGVPSNPALLQRIKRTPTQVGMTADQRRRNMQAAFAVPGKTADIFGLNIVLVDDVITTGATVDAAARVLLAAGATRVDVLALAIVTDAVERPTGTAAPGSKQLRKTDVWHRGLATTGAAFGPRGGRRMGMLSWPFQLRYLPFTVAVVALVALSTFLLLRPAWYDALVIPLAVVGGLVGVGIHDITQRRHSILRNYPIAAHLRFLLEEIRPELRQYFFEGDKDGAPFSRDQRAIVYQRAKKALDKRPFGTQFNVYSDGFEWLNHSMLPREPSSVPFRIRVGGLECAKPYSCSVLNISAMSFGSLSANAVRALNRGAAMGQFAHDTGEGGFSRYHREHGGDIIWEIGSGYFGARNPDGTFSIEKFAETAASPQIKMVELKLSQGAKPGHGGVLPAAKVTEEISKTRGVPLGEDCISPAQHSAFSTPIEMMHFIAKMRDASGGKPAGFKLCIGHPWEFLAICKAMVETGITPDFIVVDGAEGGTGAAPLEFMDHVGMPLREGLTFVHGALVGIGLRNRIKLAASGKITSAFDMARVMALGADWCNAARGFMFALGCIQAQSCHTDRCPTGVATQDPLRQRALVVPDKAERVANFHASTLKALAEVIASAGLEHPSELRPDHFSRRVTSDRVATFSELYPVLAEGELITGTDHRRYREAWRIARADTFLAVR